MAAKKTKITKENQNNDLSIKTNRKPKIQVALTTKNEEESIEYMINEIRKVGLNDIYVVDEHSDDKTEEIAKRMGVPVFQRKGSGKGFGVQMAIDIAIKNKTDILVLPDCDCTYPPKHIPDLLKYFPKYDMVVGKRDFKRVKPLHRLPNIFHTMSINLLYGGRLKDINSGMRAIKVGRFANTIDAKGFDVESQITIKALKKKMKIKEIPIDYQARRGDSKIRIKDGILIEWRIIKELFIR